MPLASAEALADMTSGIEGAIAAAVAVPGGGPASAHVMAAGIAATMLKVMVTHGVVAIPSTAGAGAPSVGVIT